MARCWWLMSVILATQDAEIRRVVVRSQSGQMVPKTLFLKKPITQKGWWSGSSAVLEFKPQQTTRWGEKIPFETASKTLKYLRINLIQKVKYLYVKNYQILIKRK
jgi:hypothetical protein